LVKKTAFTMRYNGMAPDDTWHQYQQPLHYSSREPSGQSVNVNTSASKWTYLSSF